MSDRIKKGIYERTDQYDGKMLPWNARAVMIDKIENPKPTDKPRMTFDYSKIVEKLPGMHMQLISGCYDYLSHSKHGVFMTANLKYAYSIVSVHPAD